MGCLVAVIALFLMFTPSSPVEVTTNTLGWWLLILAAVWPDSGSKESK